MDFLQELLTPMNVFITLLICLGSYAITYIIRTVVETVWTGAAKNKYWREIFLPLGALAHGMLLGLMPFLPWPALLGAHVLNRMLYGLVCGLFSSWVYAKVKSWINASSNSDSDLSV